MPHQPGFEIPIVFAVLFFVAATLTESGRAVERATEVFCSVKVALPIGVHGERVAGNSVLYWKARFWISSAYIPPSPEWLISSNINPYMTGDEAFPPAAEMERL